MSPSILRIRCPTEYFYLTSSGENSVVLHLQKVLKSRRTPTDVPWISILIFTDSLLKLELDGRAPPLNFLEQVVAEWFDLKGYFVKTNLRFGKSPGGGVRGEMDVIAFHPQTKEFVHVEASTSAASWKRQCAVIERKFNSAGQHYDDMFQFPRESTRLIAISGFGRVAPAWAKERLGESGVTLESVPEFFRKVTAGIQDRPITKGTISETLPLLRAIQFSLHCGIIKKE